MNKNTKGFSIVLAMGLALVLSYTGLYLLDYMVPFSRNIKGIENASKAFYESYGGIEDALYEVSQNNIGYEAVGDDFGYEYDILGTGSIIPASGLGNSPHDSDWNIISQSEPIQLVIGNDKLGTTLGNNRVNISLRVPNGDDLDDTAVDDDIIIWQLSSETNSISTRNGEFINESAINAGINSQTLWRGGTNRHGEGVYADGSNGIFRDFYNSYCTGNECVLKISIINPLISRNNAGAIIPYLEYQIDTPGNNIPLRFSQIDSDGTSQAYSKTLKVSVPQQTTNSAFDFTVFQ